MPKDTPEPLEPVVSYSLVPPEGGPAARDDGRVEPRLTVLPMERRPRFEEIAAPSRAEGIEHGAHRVASDEAILAPELGAKPRRRGPRITMIIGLGALLVGFGVLAATFGKVVTGGSTVTDTAVDRPTNVVMAPPAPATDETAGPGVRVIPPSGEVPLAPAAGDQGAEPAITTEGAPLVQTAEPPAPRLRPTAKPAETSQTAVASQSAGVQPLPLPVQPPLQRPGVEGQSAGAPASSGDDEVGTLMADVDRLLAQHKGASGDAAATEPLTDPGIGLMGGAAIALINPPSAPLASGDNDPLMLPPSDQALPDDSGSSGGMPVPPADIPNPGN